MESVKDLLDKGSANDLPANLSRLRDDAATTFSNAADADPAADVATQGFGAMMRALGKPNPARTRATLTSQVAHLHDVAAHILNVESPVGTNLAMVSNAPGAGEVQVAYDAVTGVPTLTFVGVVTTYTVMEIGPLPHATGAVVDAEP